MTTSSFIKFIALASLFLQTVSPQYTLSQSTAIDSLQHLITVAKDDTNKVKLFISLARAYRGVDAHKSITTAMLGVDLSKQLNSMRWIALAEHRLGSTYRLMRNYENAIIHLREAERAFRAQGDLIHAAEMYTDMGICHTQLGQTERALDTLAHSTTMYTQLLSSTDSITADNAKRGILESQYYSFAALYYANQFHRAIEWLEKMEATAIYYGIRDRLANTYSSFGATYTEMGEHAKALQYYAKAMTLAVENNGWDDQQRLLSYMSDIHFRQADYNKALELLQKALRILLTHLPEQLGYLGELYNSIARIHVKLGRYEVALDYYLKALRLFDQVGHVSNMAELKKEIGDFYHLQSDFPRAIDYLQGARKLYEQIHSSGGVANVLFGLGTIAADQGKTEEALAYHRQSLEIRRQGGEQFSITNSMYEIGNVFLRTADLVLRDRSVAGGKRDTVNHFSLPQLDSAVVYFALAEEMSHQLNDKNTEAKCLYGLGRVEELRTNWLQALTYYEKARNLSDSLGTKRELYKSYSALAAVSSRLGRHDDAYRYHTFYAATKDSVFNETSLQQMKEMQAKYESEKKDNDIERLNWQNEIAELKLKDQQSALLQVQLETGKKESDIKLLNQTRELQQQQLLNASRALTEKELEAKAKSAELEAARKDQLLQENNLQEQRLILYGTIAFAVLAMVLAIVLFSRFRLRKELDKRNAILEERRRISSDMHDDLGSSLSTIALLSQVVKGQGAEAKKEIDKIADAAQVSLEKMSEIVWSLNPRNDKLETMVAYIRKYVMEYFESSSIKCRVAVSGTVPAVEITGEYRRNIFLTIKEALHNIIKHSSATRADLTFEFVDHRLRLSIRDDGKGIHQMPHHFGNGIANMERRMKEIGAAIDFENKNGTTIRLDIPIRRTG